MFVYNMKWLKYILIDSMIAVLPAMSYVFFAYKWGETFLDTDLYGSIYVIIWMLPLILAKPLMIIVCLFLALILWIALIKKRFKIVVNFFLVAILYQVAVLFTLPHCRFFLNGFGNTIKARADFSGIQSWLEQSDFEQTNGLEEVNLADMPEQIQALKPRIIYLNVSGTSRCIELVYGKGVMKQFGVTVFNNHVDNYYQFFDCKECVFKELENGVILWQSEPCYSHVAL